MQTYLIFTEPREPTLFNLADRHHSVAGLRLLGPAMSSAMSVLDLAHAIPNNRSKIKEAHVINLLFGGHN